MNSPFAKTVPRLAAKCHLAVDLGLGNVALILALSGQGTATRAHAAWLSATFTVLWLVYSALARPYGPSTPWTTLDFLAVRLVGATGCSAMLALVAALLPQDPGFAPATFATLFYCAGALARMLVFRPLGRAINRPEDVLVVGMGSLGRATCDAIAHANEVLGRCQRVIGFLTLGSADEHTHAGACAQRAPVLGSADALLDVLREHPVTEVYLAARVTEHGALMQRLVGACERVGMPFALPLHSLRFHRAHLQSPAWSADGYLHYMSTINKPTQQALKRCIDIVAATVGLVVLSPFLLLVAVLIKLTSAGPVLFRQERVGLYGHRFVLYKFRSMVTGAERLRAQLLDMNEQTGPAFKMTRDPRVTSVGRFIRKYSIDELPQLVNILRGDMTIVGPRPALPSEVAQYRLWQRRRLSVRPGLTCYWQVTGRNDIGFEEWMRLDLLYVDTWNLGLDLQLIAQTLPIVLAGRGAS